MKHEARNTKHETNSKLEIRNLKWVWDFKFENLFRVSAIARLARPFRDFRFRISKPRPGFTLIEALIAAAILVFLAVISMSGIAVFREAAALDQAADEALELFREARTKTLASEGASEYGIHFESSALTRFKGTAYDPSSPDNDIRLLPALVEISSPPADFYFIRLTGASSAGTVVTVTFSSRRSAKTRTIQILASGSFIKQ
mgnify:CR=1 FL=1